MSGSLNTAYRTWPRKACFPRWAVKYRVRLEAEKCWRGNRG